MLAASRCRPSLSSGLWQIEARSLVPPSTTSHFPQSLLPTNNNGGTLFTDRERCRAAVPPSRPGNTRLSIESAGSPVPRTRSSKNRIIHLNRGRSRIYLTRDQNQPVIVRRLQIGVEGITEYESWDSGNSRALIGIASENDIGGPEAWRTLER